jgi:hypothetical protein
MKAKNLPALTTPRFAMLPTSWGPNAYTGCVLVGFSGQPRCTAAGPSSSDATAAAASSNETEYAVLYDIGKWPSI